MALQTGQQRFEGWAEFMREMTPGATSPITKQDLRAAYDAIDTWLSDNAAAMNIAIPQPARAALSTTEKARLFVKVLRDRYVKGA